jgi:hypothetical protein
VTVNSSGGTVTVATAGNTALTVSTGQFVGIGTSSPATKLEVSGGSVFASGANRGMTFGEQNCSILGDSATPSAANLVFYTGNAERARILAAGGIQSVTTISVGNATPSTSGAGITFPASQSASSNANTLDDYEEGTWTPTITLNSGTATTYTSPTGTYTKTGRMVTVLGSIFPTNGTIGSTNGYMRITGLPFTVGLVNGIGSGMNTSNYNNGISVTTTYSTTLDAGFVTGCAQSNTYGFVATYFV